MCQLPIVRPEYGQAFVQRHEARTGQRLEPTRRQAALEVGSHLFASLVTPAQQDQIVAILPGSQSETSPEAQEERRLARQSAGRRTTILTGARGATGFNRIGGRGMLLGQSNRTVGVR